MPRTVSPLYLAASSPCCVRARPALHLEARPAHDHRRFRRGLGGPGALRLRAFRLRHASADELGRRLATRGGFYYAVSREQYPKSLPNLIKTTFGKAIGVVPKDAQLDATHRTARLLSHGLWKTFYYYGDNLQHNFTVPLIFLDAGDPALHPALRLAAGELVHLPRRGVFPSSGSCCTSSRRRRLRFRAQPPVQGLPSPVALHLRHLMGYGALAAMTYLHEIVPEIAGATGALGLGVPALFLSLLPLWSNFDGCNQAGHWFGYDYGADMMRPWTRTRSISAARTPAASCRPTWPSSRASRTARWKHDPAFDRRDVTVITQNALCDTYYANYIRDQYDPRFRPRTSSARPSKNGSAATRPIPKCRSPASATRN